MHSACRYGGRVRCAPAPCAITEAMVASLRGMVSIRPLLTRMVLPTVVVSIVLVNMTRQWMGLENARLLGTARLVTICSSTVVSKPLGVSGATRPGLHQAIDHVVFCLRYPFARGLQRAHVLRVVALVLRVFHLHAHVLAVAVGSLSE